MVVDLHHCFAYPQSILFVCPVSRSVGSPFPFEVVEAESLLFGDHSILDCTFNQALPSAVEAVFTQRFSILGYEQEAILWPKLVGLLTLRQDRLPQRQS